VAVGADRQEANFLHAISARAETQRHSQPHVVGPRGRRRRPGKNVAHVRMLLYSRSTAGLARLHHAKGFRERHYVIGFHVPALSLDI
jgi:hypothetical protein